jgi:hypothetical protein
MVAGSAALLLQACPLCTPYDIKARLMNTADTNILNNPKTTPGELAPVARTGAGELRVDRAKAAKTHASDASDPASPSLSFGTLRTAGNTTLSRKVLVRNLDSAARTYTITPEFRFADDAASGALTLGAPPSVTVPGNGSASFMLTLTVAQPLLPIWNMNGGSQGGNGALMKSLEYDGYVKISDANDTIRLPWYFLPHKAAMQAVSTNSVQLTGGAGALQVSNLSNSTAGVVTVFRLVGTSAKQPASSLPRPGDNFAIVDLRAAGIRYVPNGGGTGADLIQFGLSTYAERAHPNYPAEFDVFMDINGDGSDDYVAFNGESGGIGVTGQNITSLLSLLPGSPQVVRFFTSADLNSSNAILNILRNDLLISGSPVAAGTQIRFRFCARDNYYTGVLTDCIGPVYHTLGTPRFAASPTSFNLVPLSNQMVGITHNPAGEAASPSQAGLLLFFEHARSGKEAEIISVNP